MGAGIEGVGCCYLKCSRIIEFLDAEQIPFEIGTGLSSKLVVLLAIIC